jgi:toxin-antitoxin system PIN domain toxin
VFKGSGGLVADVEPLSNKALLLVAFSGIDHPHHAVARAWLKGPVADAGQGSAFTLMPMVAASFLRLVTSPKIFQLPTPMTQAAEFVDALLAAPGVRFAALGSEWPKIRQLCLDRRLAGDDLPDAWLSATVVQLGEHLVSFDRDVRKLLARGQFTLLATEHP